MPLDLPIVDDEPRSAPTPSATARRSSARPRELFAEHGVENVSMDAIAAAAGVGKGTLFRRFGDRAGLALALLEEQTRAAPGGRSIRGPAPLGPGAPPQERLKALARAQLALMAEHADLMAAGRARPARALPAPGPYAFLRMHVGVLVREADPTADWELLTEFLLAPLAADVVRLLPPRRASFDVERIARRVRRRSSTACCPRRRAPAAGSRAASSRSVPAARTASAPAIAAAAPSTTTSSTLDADAGQRRTRAARRAPARVLSAIRPSRASVGPSRP